MFFGSYYVQYRYRGSQRTLTVSTTTSLYDTGLLENAVGPAFSEEKGIEVRFVPKGTGAAIEDAKMGNSDLILIHAKSREKEFLEKGHGVNRKVIAYNFFAIVGPSDDPAGISGMEPVEALKNVFELGEKEDVIWTSRDDGSGTNTREIGLWRAAGYSYEEDVRGKDWFRSTGQGMGPTLKHCSNNDSYTLADMGTFLAYSEEGLIDLEVLVADARELTNVYSVIPVNPEMYDTDFDEAMAFTRWLTSEDAQRLIADYGGEEYGRQLFQSVKGVLEEGEGDGRVYPWLVEYGFMDGMECPEEYRYKALEHDLEFWDDR